MRTIRKRSDAPAEDVQEDADADVQDQATAVAPDPPTPPSRRRVRVDAQGMADGVFVGKELAGAEVTIE